MRAQAGRQREWKRRGEATRHLGRCAELTTPRGMIVQALVDVLADAGWLACTLHIMTLMQMLMQVRRGLSSLLSPLPLAWAPRRTLVPLSAVLTSDGRPEERGYGFRRLEA
jgi:hypothetical protein